MERFRKNKENISKTTSISNIFKVKKCLFNQSHTKQNTKTDSPPLSGQQSTPESPILPRSTQDSPFFLFKAKKRRPALEVKISNDSNDSPYGPIVTTPTNKKIREKNISPKEIAHFLHSSSYVKFAVQKSMLNPDLIGDFSKPCALPIIMGRHPDLKTIAPETVANLLQRSRKVEFSIIDCRYPYEFNAGHIQTAQNIYIKEDMVTSFLNHSKTADKTESRTVLIFYCEFSSERGPRMLRHLRSSDRDKNKDCYPFLYYPELYILEGGYKDFYSSYKELCDPQQYKPMLDKESSGELAFYKSECKLRNRRSKHSKRARSALLF